MTSRLLQTEISLAALRLQNSQDELLAAIKQLQDTLAQFTQTLRYHHEHPHTVHTHPTCHTYNTNSPKDTHSAPSFHSNASTSNDSNTGIVLDCFAPVKTSSTTTASHSEAPVLLNAFTDAAGITTYNTDTSVALSADAAVPCSKSSGITSTTTDDTHPTITFLSSTATNDASLDISLHGNLPPSTSFAVLLLLIATNLHSRFAGSTTCPSPTIRLTPRPPPEPDPNHEGRSNNTDNCGITKINQ